MIWSSVVERANGTNIIKAEKIGSAVIFLRMIAEIIRLICIAVKNMRKENDGAVKYIWRTYAIKSQIGALFVYSRKWRTTKIIATVEDMTKASMTV